MTVDEYLQFEEKSPVRHEYVNGSIYAMTGVSVAHARIGRELVIALGGHLRGGPCEPFSASLKLLIRSDTDEIIYSTTYRRIASLEEYVLLAQDDHKVIVQRRAESWRPQSYSGPQATVEFRSIGACRGAGSDL